MHWQKAEKRFIPNHFEVVLRKVRHFEVFLWVCFKDNREAWKKVMTRNNRGFRYVGLNVTSSEPRGQD